MIADQLPGSGGTARFAGTRERFENESRYFVAACRDRPGRARETVDHSW